MTRSDKPRSVATSSSNKSGTPPNGAGAPPLTPAGIARSELGRFYWGERQQRNLVEEMAAAERRLEGHRRSWQAALRRQREAETAEWIRRKVLAQRARAAQQAGELMQSPRPVSRDTPPDREPGG